MPRRDPIRDRFQEARGEPQFLVLRCNRCRCQLGVYQKDGPGPLRRAYLDRFHVPDLLATMATGTLEDLPPMFTCPECGEPYGSPMRYGDDPNDAATHPGEKRLAIRLFAYAVDEETESQD